MEYNFKVVEDLILETSYGVIGSADQVELDVTIGIHEDKETGWFEISSENDDEWYAEGGLWFDGMTVTEYDGVFSLASFIVDKLKELGYDTTEVE